MKALKNYFLLVALALISAFATSCGGKDEDELEGFIQLDNPQTFYNTYKSRGENGTAILVDVRSAEDFAKDGLPGAKNLSVMKEDGKSINFRYLDPKLTKVGSWPERLLNEVANGDKNVAIFLYGVSNFTYTRDIAGQASTIGFGKKNTYVYISKLEDLQKVAQ